MTGSAFRPNITAPAEHFVNSAAPKSYIKTAETGNKRRQAFWGSCGAQLWACAVEEPQGHTLRAGTITWRAAFSPRRQM